MYIVDGSSTYHNIYSFQPGAANVAASRVSSDYETSQRIGSNQATLRVGITGGAFLALGQRR